MRNALERKHLLIFSVAFAGILGAIASWHALASSKDQSKPERTPTPVQTMSVEQSPVQSTETFSGFVQGIQHANITPKISGYVISLLKEPGDIVRSGDILALLDGNELTAGNQSVALSLTAALTSLDRTEQYTKQQVDAAETTLSKVKDDRNRGTATDKDVRVAEDAVRTARKLRDAENAQAAASVATLQGAEVISRATLENRIVRAPFSGIIASKQTSVGSLASPNNVLYSLVSPNNIEIPVSIPLRFASAIRKGSSVSIVPEFSDTHIDGEVFSVAPIANPATGETIATIRLHTANAKSDSVPEILPGQYASVLFTTEPSRDALLVPDSAVIRQYDETFVFTVVDSKAHKQPIVIGNRYDHSREILDGLDAGDIVITAGEHTLREGTPIQADYHE